MDGVAYAAWLLASSQDDERDDPFDGSCATSGGVLLQGDAASLLPADQSVNKSSGLSCASSWLRTKST